MHVLASGPLIRTGAKESSSKLGKDNVNANTGWLDDCKQCNGDNFSVCV